LIGIIHPKVIVVKYLTKGISWIKIGHMQREGVKLWREYASKRLPRLEGGTPLG
jgi:hypothetical protein